MLKGCFFSLALALYNVPCQAIDNGLGRTPPMGWRGWMLFGTSPSQKKLEAIFPGMVSRNRSVDGKPTSLCDLGYCSVGLDNNWQKNAGDKYVYHDNDGNPIVNFDRFPSMANMTALAHSMGLKASWYGNNCENPEKEAPLAMYKGDVAALTRFGYDGIKLDGCGAEYDLDLWAKLINATGRPVMIENCHWGKTLPNATWCPWNFFRTSGDIGVGYSSVVKNMMATNKVAEKNLSRPGCWGYPDNLVVGTRHWNDNGGLTLDENYAHFGMWCIMSAPLILSLDVNNNTQMDNVWPIISNKEAIAVNQAWAGESGRTFNESDTKIDVSRWTRGIPLWQAFSKAMPDGKVAVLLVNHGNSTNFGTLDLSFTWDNVPSLACSGECRVRDVWKQQDLGTHRDGFTTQVRPHGSAFLIVG